MAKQKIYSLCIGINKLRRLKSGHDTVISREASDRWIRFYKKKQTKVRFYDLTMYDSCAFTVKKVEMISQLGKTIIRIEIDEVL